MIGVSDVETYNSNNGEMVPYLIVIIGDETKYFFGSNPKKIIEEGSEYIVSKNIKNIFFHNLNFDGPIILKYLPQNFKIRIISNENTIYGIILKNNNDRITIKCSYRLMPQSLEKLAEDLNIGVKKTKFPHDLVNKDNINSKEPFDGQPKTLKDLAVEYCINDVKITQMAIYQGEKEIKKFKLSIIKTSTSGIYSISGASLKIFENNFNNLKLKYENNKFHEFISESYYGGRCEVFGNAMSGEIVKHFDFKSMYPSCMKENYPLDAGVFVLNPSKIRFGVYNIDFISKKEIPMLPIRYAQKLIFPNSETYLNGTYFSEEIEKFVSLNGAVVKINGGIEYYKVGKCFTSFVETFTRLKDADDGYKKFYKLILNSLYGKYGTRRKKKELIAEKKEYGYKICEKESKQKFIDKNVIVCAITTARARIKLYDAFMECIINGGRPLYCDTDSIFASFKTGDESKDGKIINGDKNELKDTLFVLPKMYFIGEQEKIKGVRKLNGTIRSMVENNEKISINQGRIRNVDKYPHYETFTKNINIKYDKRIGISNYETKSLEISKEDILINLNK